MDGLDIFCALTMPFRVLDMKRYFSDDSTDGLKGDFV